MTLAIEELPNDVTLLKRLVVEVQRSAAAEIERLQAERQAAIDAAVRIAVDAAVQAAVAAILRRYYGPRSERFDPRQLLLFGQAIDQLPLDEAAIAAEAGEPLVTRRIKKRHNHGRSPLPEHLERIEIEHDLDDSQKACPACGCERCRIGAEISEQLEYFPASFKVLKHVRPKYGCPKCDHDGYDPQIATAEKPPQPIAKGLAGPSLLAYVVVSKLGDHLPLYRLERIFERQQVHVARSTMCAWMAAAGELVRPLVERMIERVKQSQVIHTDDTPVPIQSPGELPGGQPGKQSAAKQCRKGRIWCYLGDDQHPYTVYDYTPNRKRAGPVKWLGKYKGFLQADAYSGYDEVFNREQVTEVACWAHARRKFYDAQDSDRQRALEMLALVGELYAVEREAKEQQLDEAARLALRQQRSVPVLARIKTWLDAEVVLPRSPMAAAIGYAKNQWAALNTYTTQGFLNIDNNAAERALKRVALGRKNWLFAGHDAAAANTARLWSLIASAERHALDPQRYLTSVLAKIGQTPAEDLEQFLPDTWKAEDAAEPIAEEK